jgi:hypothetical protein
MMRATSRRRPRKDTRLASSSDVNLSEIAAQATYVISAEHKDYLTAAGPGRLRSDASACPRDLDFDEVVGWLRKSIRDGDVSAAFEGDFPRYAWARVQGHVYEARLSNSGTGAYKGYPIHGYEAPAWLT